MQTTLGTYQFKDAPAALISRLKRIEVILRMPNYSESTRESLRKEKDEIEKQLGGKRCQVE